MPPRIDGDALIRHMIGRTVMVGECWIWQGRINNRGYPVSGSRINGRPYAHRLMYELLRGPIPDGLTIDHLCRTPKCINPSHLEPVTMKENTHRGISSAVTYMERTHCSNGHEYNESNTLYRTDGGGRRCRTCDRDKKKAAYMPAELRRRAGGG